MKIHEQSDNRLMILQHNLAHRAICIILIGIGLIGTLAVVFSGEGLVNGIIFYLFLIAGPLNLKFFGKPDSVLFDKETNSVEIKACESSFSRPKSTILRLNEVKEAELDEALFSSSSRTGYAVVLILSDGTKMTVTPYVSGKRSAGKIIKAVQSFLTE